MKPNLVERKVQKEKRQSRNVTNKLTRMEMSENVRPEFMDDLSLLPEDPTEEEAQEYVEEVFEYLDDLLGGVVYVEDEENDFFTDRSHAISIALNMKIYLTELKSRFELRVPNTYSDFLQDDIDAMGEFAEDFQESSNILELWAYITLAIHEVMGGEEQLGILNDIRGAEGLILSYHLESLIEVVDLRVEQAEARIELLEVLRGMDVTEYRSRLVEAEVMVTEMFEDNEASRVIFYNAIYHNSDVLSKSLYHEMVVNFRDSNALLTQLNLDITHAILFGY